jgi:hypothetical protein
MPERLRFPFPRGRYLAYRPAAEKPVLQDGGLPVEGLARILGGDRWDELARTHLLTRGE